MTRNKGLKRCMEEVETNPESRVVTGVAGYLVVENKVDAAVGRESTLVNALDAALESGRTRWYWPWSEDDNVSLDARTKHNLARRWTENVERVAGIATARNDLSTTAYPLWIQLQ
jgi:hypothetical protein